MPLLMLAPMFLAGTAAAHAQSNCKETYSVCMAACATERMAERCMQKCAPLRDRCPELRTEVPAAASSKPDKRVQGSQLPTINSR
jgi:hypothetical protein